MAMVAVDATDSSQPGAGRRSLLQPRRKREINVRKALGEDVDVDRTMSMALVPTNTASGFVPSVSSVPALTGSALLEKFKPKLYVPSKMKTSVMPETSGTPSYPTENFASGHQEPSHYSSRLIFGINGPDTDEPSTGICTSRGMFKLRARRNIRVKSVDDLDNDGPAARSPRTARRVEPREPCKVEPRKEYMPIVKTGFLTDQSKDRLARQEQQTVTDMLGSNGSSYQPLHMEEPAPPIETHFNMSGGDISEDMTPEYVAPFEPSFTQYSVPPLALTAGTDHLGHINGHDVMVDNNIAQNGASNEAGYLPDAEPLRTDPVPGLVVPPSVDNYQERIAAITSRIHASSTIHAIPVAPPSGEETIDEKKDRILRNLMKSKMDAAAAARPTITNPNYETLEEKKAKMFAKLREKHSGNTQAQNLLEKDTYKSLTHGYDILGLSSKPPPSRSLSLGASLGSEPRQLVGIEFDDVFSQDEIQSQGLSHMDMFTGQPQYTDSVAMEPQYMDSVDRDPQYMDSVAREPQYMDRVAREPQYMDSVARAPQHMDSVAMEPQHMGSVAMDSQYMGRVDMEPQQIDSVPREPQQMDSVAREPQVGMPSRAPSGALGQASMYTDTQVTDRMPIISRNANQQREVIVLGRQARVPSSGTSVTDSKRYQDVDYNNSASHERLRGSPSEDICSVDSGFHGGDIPREESPRTNDATGIGKHESPRSARSVSRERRKEAPSHNLTDKKTVQKPSKELLVKPPIPASKAGPKTHVKPPAVRDTKKVVESRKPGSIWNEIATAGDGDESPEETLIRPSDVKAAAGNLVLKKSAPPTKPKPGARSENKVPVSKPPTPQKSHQSRPLIKSSQPPRPKSAPPNKSKSVLNLSEVPLSPLTERRGSVASTTDDMEGAAAPFSRNSRLRSSTKAWDMRQAEKQVEVRSRRASLNTVSRTPPRPSTPKRSIITGQVSLSPERAATVGKEKPQHTPRSSSNYDKPWRTGTALKSAGSFTIRSAHPDRLTPEKQKKPMTSGSSSGSSSRTQSPSGRPKNPVKGPGSVALVGCPRSPRKPAQINSPTQDCEQKASLRTNIKPKVNKKPPIVMPNRTTKPTTPKPFNFTYIPRHRRSSQSSDASDLDSDRNDLLHDEQSVMDDNDNMDGFLHDEQATMNNNNTADPLVEEWKCQMEAMDEFFGTSMEGRSVTVSPDSGMSLESSTRISPTLTNTGPSIFTNWIDKPTSLDNDQEYILNTSN